MLSLPVHLKIVCLYFVVKLQKKLKNNILATLFFLIQILSYKSLFLKIHSLVIERTEFTQLMRYVVTLCRILKQTKKVIL